MSEFMRIVLLCLAGTLVLSQNSYASPMSFILYKVDNCNDCWAIIADGEITNETPQIFDKFIIDNKLNYIQNRPVTILFNSPGGSVAGGLKLGEKIRFNGISTHIGIAKVSLDGILSKTSAGVCASSCAYAFLGGSKRSIGLNSKYGLHQISSESNEMVTVKDAIGSTQDILAIINSYVINMGASSKIISIATETKPDQISWISPDELYELKIVNSKGIYIQDSWRLLNQDDRDWIVESISDHGKVVQYSLMCSNDWSRDVENLILSAFFISNNTISNFRTNRDFQAELKNSNNSYFIGNALLSASNDKVSFMQKIPVLTLKKAAKKIDAAPYIYLGLDEIDANIIGEFIGPIPTNGLDTVISKMQKACAIY